MDFNDHFIAHFVQSVLVKEFKNFENRSLFDGAVKLLTSMP